MPKPRLEYGTNDWLKEQIGKLYNIIEPRDKPETFSVGYMVDTIADVLKQSAEVHAPLPKKVKDDARIIELTKRMDELEQRLTAGGGAASLLELTRRVQAIESWEVMFKGMEYPGPEGQHVVRRGK